MLRTLIPGEKALRDMASVDLETAADQLGVHYQTAYRWVRAGLLKASLVEGRYRLDPEVLAKFAEERSRPKQPRPRRPRQGFNRLRERFVEHLLGNEEGAAHQLVRGLVDGGVSVSAVIEEVIAPAMADIGERWVSGRLTIAEDHQATAIVERILAANLPSPRGRRRGTVVVAALSGDRHSLPTLMATVALREDNWHVRHLGADLPPGELVQLCESQSVDLVVLTVTATEAAEAAHAVARHFEQLGVPALVGRPGATLVELQRLARERRLRS